MALCEEYNDTKSISEVARYVVESIPAEKLECYAKFSEAFKRGGFRLSNIKGIRSQVIRLIESKEKIDQQLRNLLSEYSQCSRVLSLLSTDTILGHKKELETIFGVEQVFFAALLDPRERIRSEAIEDLPGKSAETEEDDSMEWARSRMNELLWPLQRSFGTAGQGTGSETSGNFAIDNELKELRSKAKRLEHVEKQLQLAVGKAKEADARSKNRELAAAESEKEAGAFKQRAERAEAELARNIQHAKDQSEAIVQSRLAREFAGWLDGTRVEELEKALPKDLFEGTSATCAGDGDFNRLVSKSRKALLQQANADSISGVRSVFEKRLALLQELLGQTNEALANAMRPTEALLEARRELEAACSQMQMILHPGEAEDSRVYEVLAVHINTSQDRHLPEWKHTADKLHAIGLLSDQSHRMLLELVRRRYAALHLQGKREIRAEELDDTRNILRLGLEGHLPVVLLIDGHNMLFALQSRYVRPQDHHVPSSEAREWLQEDVVRMVSQSPACRVILAFDGPERSDSFVAPNVKLIYSGGTGDHRADRVLVDEARFIVQNGEKVHMLLTTNDRDLADNAAKLGVGNLSPADLLEHFS